MAKGGGEEVSHDYRGGWVFKENGVLYGPVPAEVLTSMLERGELGPETLVARESGPFTPVGTVEPFVQVAARAAASRRVRAEEARRGSRRRRRLAAGGLASLAVAILWLAPWREDPTLRRELGAIRIETLPLVVGALPQEAADEGWEEYQGEVGAPARLRPGPARVEDASQWAADSADELSIETRYDVDAIQQVVRANRDGLHTCILEQARSDERFRGEVPLSFVVDSSGKVSLLWVDKTGYRRGPLYDCLLGRMRGWSFPSFAGQSPAISLTFRVGG